jgi:hypothetical protein
MMATIDCFAIKGGGTAIPRDLAREPELRDSMSAIASNRPYNSLCYDAVRGSYEIQKGTR